jgi:hypothetical protein
MGLFEKLRARISGPRLIDELETLAGQCEALVNRMRLHAERGLYPAIANEVRAIAEQEAAHERTLRGILAESGRWPRPPENLPRDGSNNWERLSGDLEILVQFTLVLQRQAMRWESEHPAIGETLNKIASEASDSEFKLRRLAAKLDPQALD